MTAYNPITRTPNNFKQVGETLEGLVYFVDEKLDLDIRTLVVNPNVKYAECIQIEFDFYKIPKMRFGIEAKVSDFDADGTICLADSKKDVYLNIFSDYYALMSYPIKKEFSLNTATSASEIKLTSSTNAIDMICEYIKKYNKPLNDLNDDEIFNYIEEDTMNFRKDLKLFKSINRIIPLNCDFYESRKRRDQLIKNELIDFYTRKIPKAILENDKDILSVAVITRKNPKDFPKWEVGYLVYKHGNDKIKISDTTRLTAEDISKLPGLSDFGEFIKNITDYNLQSVLTSFYIGNVPVINLEMDIKAYHELSQLKKIYHDGFKTNPNLQNGKIYKEYIKPEDFGLARKHLFNLLE